MDLSPKLMLILLLVLFLTPEYTLAAKHKRACKASVTQSGPSATVTQSIDAIILVAEPTSSSDISTPTSGLGAVQTTEASTPLYTDKVIGSMDLPKSDTISAVSATSTSDGNITASSVVGTTTSVAGSLSVPATSSATTNGSPSAGKAGVGLPVQEVDAAPVAQFFTPESTVAWWFNWNKNWNQGVMTSDGVSIDGEFVPMIFGPTYLDNEDTFQEGFTELMGYNEPDLKTSTGVSVYLEPAQAAETWKTQIVQIRQQYPNVKIHSPVMASNKTWLSDFFKAICPDNSPSDGWGDCVYKPDYVSTHLYNTDVEYFKGTLTAFQKEFGLPMVLSEFACYQFGSDPHPSLEEVSTFMQETTAWLDQQDWVVKYAWFGNARNSEYLFGVYETNRLMDASGALTDLGRQYMNGGKKISA
ncbi:hypothetical protein I302_103959 [Kwoniella bestiolae CBS 10118]|uniref:Asl1-like glycosyl hydrolase catalytic domain-containing protein n=1 Tax=Kwoniella bestiolae CBS 10118 TaxID=1296100 RepID=A0A1B9G9X5_9TREE|nr:hypothetical protein I302_02665 [Kwoniella bestiolae CBS 10118]OCF27816.1 hypothetical protein I302_02665 [Kwoniella bestiolae CBS 10118]